MAASDYVPDLRNAACVFWGVHRCQIFSTGLSSGLFEGIATIEMLVGSSSLGVRCQPAWSISSTAWAPGAMVSDISAR